MQFPEFRNINSGNLIRFFVGGLIYGICSWLLSFGAFIRFLPLWMDAYLLKLFLSLSVVLIWAIYREVKYILKVMNGNAFSWFQIAVILVGGLVGAIISCLM